MKFFISISIILFCFNLITFSQTKMIIAKHDGTSDSINLADIKSISFKNNPNLIKNGSFDSDLQNWILIGNGPNPYHPEDAGRADFTIENGVVGIDIKNQGISIWSIMLYQRVMFEKGATYNISFDAKSDFETEIISNVAEENGNWTVYSGDKKFVLSNTMKRYSYQFTMTVSGQALFQFCLGTLGTGKLYFDNIVLTKQ